MTYIVVENLRGFVTGRPPLVMFMVCLASFAIVLISFAYVVRTRDLPNPDVTEDWNTFLTKFSNLEFCVDESNKVDSLTDKKLGNGTNGYEIATPVPARKDIGEQHPADLLKGIHNSIKEGTRKIFGAKDQNKTREHTPLVRTDINRIIKRDVSQKKYESGAAVQTTEGLSTQTVLKPTPPNEVNAILNVTIPMNMEIALSEEVLSHPLQSLQFKALVSGKIFMLNEPSRYLTLVISLSFPSNLSRSNCIEWDKTKCSLYLVNTCVTFQGPVVMFPRAPKPATSQICEGSSSSSAKVMTADDYVRTMTARTLTLNNWCAKGTRLTAEFSFDESLTVLLSQQDRSMVNLHLMRTSYFLFVMVITLLCYAMVKGRPGKVKTIHIPYEKVMTTGT